MNEMKPLTWTELLLTTNWSEATYTVSKLNQLMLAQTYTTNNSKSTFAVGGKKISITTQNPVCFREVGRGRWAFIGASRECVLEVPGGHFLINLVS